MKKQFYLLLAIVLAMMLNACQDQGASTSKKKSESRVFNGIYEGTLYFDSKVGNDFTSFLSTNTGFGNVGMKNGKPFIDVKYGKINVNKCIVSGTETAL